MTAMRETNTWWEQANCRNADPRDFEKARSQSGRARRDNARVKAKDDWAIARAICEPCPVRQDCLREALTHPPTLIGPHEEMFVAGYTPEEMRELRKKYEQARRLGVEWA